MDKSQTKFFLYARTMLMKLASFSENQEINIDISNTQIKGNLIFILSIKNQPRNSPRWHQPRVCRYKLQNIITNETEANSFPVVQLGCCFLH